MFTAWVMDSDGEVRKQFDDCMQVSVLSEEQMQIDVYKRQELPTLNDVFLEITGKQLRD